MRNRWNDFRCLYTANLVGDQTHEVDYTWRTSTKEPELPKFSVTISIEGLICQIPSDMRDANPEAYKLFNGTTATLCIATNGSEFVPRSGERQCFELNPQKRSAFIAMRAPSIEVASSMAAQMRTHKRIGVYIEFAANEKDFVDFDQSIRLNIPIWSASITYYASEIELQ